MQKKVLIIFTDPQLAYSQSTLLLYNALKDLFYVDLFVPVLKKIPLEKLEKNYTIRSVSAKRAKLNFYLDKFFDMATRVVLIVFPKNLELANRFKRVNEKTLSTKHFLKKNKYDEIIAVDFLAMWCVSKRSLNAHFFSLEIHEDDIYQQNINAEKIKSIIIQSKQRLEYLFPATTKKVFYIQNAPNFFPVVIDTETRLKKDILFCGSAIYPFGIINCLDFINDYPEYCLTVKGNVPAETMQSINLFYTHLLENGQLIIDKTYLSYDELNKYLTKFRIGLAFYDFFRFKEARGFNYYTAPSGKVFQYLNAGIPVIGNNIDGFRFLETDKAGVLTPTLSSLQIKKAIDKIEEDYKTYAQNAKQLSKEYDFSIMVTGFKNYLLQT